MNECNWTITSLYVKPVEGSYTDVVIQAAWLCSKCSNPSDAGMVANANGVATFTTIGDPFTQYDQLTQDQVLGWCWANGVDKDAVEAQVSSQLEEMLNPPVVTPPLPWADAS